MKKTKYLIAIISILAFLSSCKKDSTIGADILPSDDLLNLKFSDTFTLQAKTLEDTFLRTDKLAKNYLGVINDPIFGTQKASIVLEVDKPNTVYDDTLGPFTLDSVVLLIKYNLVYGDTTVPQDFKVSTITNPINENNLYYSNTSIFPAGSVIGTLNNYTFTPSNKVIMSTTDTTGSTNIFRVKLNSTVGYSILNLGQAALLDSATFKGIFPGIRIENASNNGNAMAEMDISSSSGAIVIYYKDKKNTQREMRLFTSVYRAVSGVIVARQNSINLFSNTKSATVQNTINSGQVSDSVNYILGQGGTIVRLSLPTIKNHNLIAINKAEIKLTQIIQNSSTDLQTPPYILLLKRNSSGQLDVLPTADGLGIIDSTGTDAFGNIIARYSINITNYVQDVVKGLEDNSDLYVATYRSGGTDPLVNNLNTIINSTIINYGYTPYRVIVAGPNYSDAKYKMKFNLTYTLIE